MLLCTQARGTRLQEDWPGHILAFVAHIMSLELLVQSAAIDLFVICTLCTNRHMKYCEGHTRATCLHCGQKEPSNSNSNSTDINQNRGYLSIKQKS